MQSRTFLTRIISVFIGLVVLGSISVSVFPAKANAQLLVQDPFNQVFNTITSVSTAATKTKDFVLDPIAWAVSKAVLQSVVNSTVNSVNHGANGSPSFVTNLNSTLQAVGDTAANNFISQLATNGSIKSPFQTQIASAVSTNYLQSTSAGGFFTQNAYTLNKTTSNDAAFLGGNFSAGGWNAWMSAIINPQNNPYGAYGLASAAASQQATAAQTTQKAELNFGKGFLSSRGNCPTSTTGGSTTGASGATSLSANSTCQSSSIQTPGSVIESQLEKSLGSGIDTLVSAHTFDELVNALLGQLTKQVLGSSGGLSGLSQTSTATGGTTYLAQTDTTQASISSDLSTSFSSTIAGQITQVQQFQTEWNSINAAAQVALAVLANGSCYIGAQTAITTTIQPVINEATASLSQANTSIVDLQKIEAEVPSANSTTDQTTALSQASSDYSTLLSGGTLPTAEQIDYAQTQSSNTSTSSSPTLIQQMQQITQQAQLCQIGR